MNELQENTIYLIGIGGIGMSALARYFKQQGRDVSGYDRIESPLTRKLQEEGIDIHYDDDPAYIPCDAGLVIYTPAIPESNRELQYCRETGFNIKKRAEVLGMIAAGFNTIAIAGTHGKTTISSMVAHCMHHNGLPVNAIIGGIMSNYDTNMLQDSNSRVLIAEADEYDRSFLQLHPATAVISSLAADHLDIYGSADRMKQSFSEFISQLSDRGQLIVHESVRDQLDLPGGSFSYGTGAENDLQLTNIGIREHHYHFDLRSGQEKISVRMMVPGEHNIENAAAAAGACLHAGMGLKQIREGLESYRGVKRRFEFILEDEAGTIFIDDYAHHPDEISACISTARSLYPDREICGIFQPHLYSRTRDLADGFAHALEALDRVILLDIYPAREKAIPGVDSKMLLGKIKKDNKQLCSREELPALLGTLKPELLITMGAGDIDQLVEPIKMKLINP